jgi:hypothetical protein
VSFAPGPVEDKHLRIKEEQPSLYSFSPPEPEAGDYPLCVQRAIHKPITISGLCQAKIRKNRLYEVVNEPSLRRIIPAQQAHPVRQYDALFFLLPRTPLSITVGATESGTAGYYLHPSPQKTPMTRQELLRIVVLRARVHGFEFRQWFQTSLESEWPGFDQAVATLSSGRRYYALLFSHEFASHFWKKGTQITFLLPSQEYTRLDASGKVVTIKRKSFTRRSSRSTSNTVWQYHLEQMAVWDEPLRYIRRFILTEEELEAAGEQPAAAAVPVEPIESKESHTVPRRAVDWC